MSSLFLVDYQGVAGSGHATIYIGKGILLGADNTGSRYTGNFGTQGNQMSGTAKITSAGATLVTGQAAPLGTVVAISFSLPLDFDNGSYHPITVGGQIVNARFQKLGNIP